jgi:hypothetical protein
MTQRGLFPSIGLDETWLETSVSPLYPQLWRMIRSPFDDLLGRRVQDQAFRIMDEGETAQWLRPQIVELARQIFDGNNEVKVEKRNQQLYLNYKNTVAITPKKFKPARDGKGITFSSYDTRQNTDYWHHREVAGLPMLPRLIVGYQFVDEMTDIKIWVAYPYGKHVKTCILMPDQTGAIIGLHQPTADDLGEAEDPGFKVTPKKNRKGKKDDREIG